LQIVVFNTFFPPAFLAGGPIRTLGAMMASAPPEFRVSVVTTNTDLGRLEPLNVPPNEWLPHENGEVFYSSTGSWMQLLRAMNEARRLKPKIIYTNSFFDAKFSILPLVLSVCGWLRSELWVIAPRGEFSLSALKIKGWKKRPYIRFFKAMGLYRRVFWHASSADEAADVRRVFGNTARIVIRENDTLLPANATKPIASGPGPLRAVALSRVSPVKGIDTLLSGLGQVSKSIILDIIGPPEDKQYYQRCLRITESLPPHIQVNFVGSRPNNQIRRLLSQYDVMLNPTKGENFGHAIAEALSSSCPVLCADVTPWSARLAAGGGVLVPSNTSAGWAAAINDYAEKTPVELFERKQRAGAVYNEWRASTTQTHVFSLFADILANQDSDAT
jgi:glycosyltransferase involved in cell wall biosynthesis